MYIIHRSSHHFRSISTPSLHHLRITFESSPSHHLLTIFAPSSHHLRIIIFSSRNIPTIFTTSSQHLRIIFASWWYDLRIIFASSSEQLRIILTWYYIYTYIFPTNSIKSIIAIHNCASQLGGKIVKSGVGNTADLTLSTSIRHRQRGAEIENGCISITFIAFLICVSSDILHHLLVTSTLTMSLAI